MPRPACAVWHSRGRGRGLAVGGLGLLGFFPGRSMHRRDPGRRRGRVSSGRGSRPCASDRGSAARRDRDRGPQSIAGLGGCLKAARAVERAGTLRVRVEAQGLVAAWPLRARRAWPSCSSSPSPRGRRWCRPARSRSPRRGPRREGTPRPTEPRGRRRRSPPGRRGDRVAQLRARSSREGLAASTRGRRETNRSRSSASARAPE